MMAQRIALFLFVFLMYIGSSAMVWATDRPGPKEQRSTLEDQTAVAVTIYNDNLALVRDRRKVRLDQGQNRLALREVSARIQPETALIRSLSHPGALTVQEQNFDFDLLTPQKLLEKYVGRTVQVVKTHPQTGVESYESAQVLAASGGVVLRMKNRIETGIPGRLVYPDVPENLKDRPTLVVDLLSDTRQVQTLEMSYLTGGMSWRADYVARLAPTEEKLDLTGWVTLTNQSGAPYRNATLQLVAGDVHRVSEVVPKRAELMMARGRMMDAVPEMREEGLFEYHLYTLERPASIEDNQTKQVALLAATSVPVKKELVLQGSDYYYHGPYGDLGEKVKVGVFLEWENTTVAHLGIPLPKGVVRVYKEDQAGQDQFIGEDRIDHTPKGEKVRLKLGESFDVTATKKQTDFKKLGGFGRYKNRFESAYEIELKNGGEAPVTVTVQEPLPGDWQIISESASHSKEAAHTAVWTLEVPAEGKAVLTYRVRVQY